MLPTDNNDLSHHPQLLSFIDETLKTRQFLFRFPPLLETPFIEKRIRDSLAFIKTGHYFLILLFFVIIMNIVVYFEDIATANNFEIIKNSYIPLSMGIFFILYGSKLAQVQKYFYYFMTPVSIYILCIIIKLALSYQDDYSEFVIYHLMIAIILMAFGLRFVFPLFILILSFVAIFTGVFVIYNNINFDYAKFSNYYILYCCVIITLAAITEWHERLAFLQGLLLDHQTAQLTRMNQQLDRIAHEDVLTGIANRRSFDDIAHKEWDRGLRDKQPLTILLLDVDFFKRFNDYYGHGAGDDCLRRVAQAIRSSTLRTFDVVARYGGEEFVILLPNTQANGGVKVAERVLTAVDNLLIPHIYSTASAHVSVSIGITTVIASHSLTLAQVLKQADIAMYRAKSQGRHQFAVYEATTRDKSATDSSSALVNPNF